MVKIQGLDSEGESKVSGDDKLPTEVDNMLTHVLSEEHKSV